MIAKSRLRIAISAVALIVLCLCVGIILTACSNVKSTQEKPLETNEIEKVKPKSGVISYHGKYLQLADNIEELDDSSPVIVTVTKESEKTSITSESCLKKSTEFRALSTSFIEYIFY
ncbi:hypothetical protein IA623_11990 [Listeria seeligeri]|uniref:hypothetical protein n=1 Tax=Listeria seeligeri TaxID=1640 RepID=UPI0016288AAD|nr:hypothetical protein [Listeria seeligeri]MBF2540028.1 hypothetical protein [Listeria seeligeri]MBF2606160.1 hypothetical protein [Listeria seeligeri]